MGLWAASIPPQMSPILFCHAATTSQPDYLAFSCGQTLPSSTPFALYGGVVLISRALREPPETPFSSPAHALSPVLEKPFLFVPAQNEKTFGNLGFSCSVQACLPCFVSMQALPSFASRDTREPATGIC